MASAPPPPENWTELLAQLQLLGAAGMAGAFFRAVLAPEGEWRRRIVQGLAGALSAIFLGGVLAGTINALVNVGPYAYLGAGFLMGSGGELAVKAIQDKLLGGPK
jgi:hypothetical protein